jgi:twitching motility protein PilJ
MARSTDFAQEYQQAEKAYMQGRYEEAAEVVDRLVGDHPQDPSARLLRGHIYCYGLQRYDVAQEQYQTVLDLTQDSEFVDYANSGLLYAQQSAEESNGGGIRNEPDTEGLNGGGDYTTNWQDDNLDSFILSDMDFEDDNSAGFTVDSSLQDPKASNFEMPDTVTPTTLTPTTPPAMTNIMDDMGELDERSSNPMSPSDPFASFGGPSPTEMASSSANPFSENDGFMDMSWQDGDQDGDVFSDFNNVFGTDAGVSSGGLMSSTSDRGEDTSSQGPTSTANSLIPPAFPVSHSPFQETNDRWGGDEAAEETMFMAGSDFGTSGMPDFVNPSSAHPKLNPPNESAFSPSSSASGFATQTEVPAQGSAMDFIDDFDEFDDLGNLADFDMSEDSAGFTSPSVGGAFAMGGAAVGAAGFAAANAMNDRKTGDRLDSGFTASSIPDDDLFSISGGVNETLPTFTQMEPQRVDNTPTVEQGPLAPLENAPFAGKQLMVALAAGMASALAVGVVSFLTANATNITGASPAEKEVQEKVVGRLRSNSIWMALAGMIGGGGAANWPTP